MAFWPSSWSPRPALALLVLLIVGHVLADFLVQPRYDVQAKTRGRRFGSHGVAVLGTHLIVLLPLLSIRVVGVLVAVAVVHVAVDWVTFNWIPEAWGRLKPFAFDQGAHVLVLVAAWASLVALDGIPAYHWLSAEQMGTYLGGAILASAFAFNATGGSVIVAGILDLLPDEEGEGDEGDGPAGYEGAGRMIGILERTLVLALVLYEQWAAIVLLVTAKSIARFEEIKVRKFAEYYLIGTLASLLVALVVGFVLAEILPALML